MTNHRTLVLALSVALAAACSGKDGATGKDGTNGEAGPSGEGAAGEPSISGIVPGSAFLGGSASVTISGYATTWTDQAAVDFGSGVTVKTIAVASPTAIVADIDVAFDAAVGQRDVTVSDGGSALVYKRAFRVGSPTALDTQGTVAQGSVVLAKVRNLDFSRPFDTTQAGDGLFTPITYPDIELSTGTGISAQLNGVQPYLLDILMLVDMDTAAGPAKVDVLSGPVGSRTSFANPEAVEIAARTPQALTVGQDQTVTVDQPHASKLFAFTPGSGLRIIGVTATTSNTTANPQVFVLGPSGHFGDAIGLGADVGYASDTGDKLHVVYWDNSGTSGYDATIRATEVPATGGAEGEPNDDSATAHGVAAPFVVQGASLADGADEDWFKLTVAAADVGKAIHVRSFGDDPLTDSVVEVLDSTATSLGGPSDDLGYHENWYSTPITAAGTYYVVVSPSTYFDPAHGGYSASIQIE